MKTKIIVIISFIMSLSAAPLFAASTALPVIYPNDELVKSHPLLFFWPDDRTEKNRISAFTGNLTLVSPSGEKKTHAFTPKYADDTFHFEFLGTLEKGKYEYTIDLIEKGRPLKSSFFGYMNYPIKGIFEYAGDQHESGYSAEETIRLYRARHYNKIENGYNALFFGGSSILSGGVAYLLLTVFDFNIVTRVIGYIAAGSAIAGAGATGVYTWRYATFNEKEWRENKHSYSPGAVTLKLSHAL